MDFKILAAVFTTLAVVFIILGGGDVEPEVEQVVSEDESFFTDILPSISIMDRLFEPPEPDTQVEIELELLDPENLQITASKLEAENMNNLEGSTELTSQNDIGLRNFDGNIDFTNETMITGSATGFYSDEISTNTSLTIDQSIETNSISAFETELSDYSYQVESIELSSNETSSELNKSNTAVNIDSFMGDIEIRPEDQVLVFDGLVSRVNAGQTSFGN